jgi:hypothetical protein
MALNPRNALPYKPRHYETPVLFYGTNLADGARIPDLPATGAPIAVPRRSMASFGYQAWMSSLRKCGVLLAFAGPIFFGVTTVSASSVPAETESSNSRKEFRGGETSADLSGLRRDGGEFADPDNAMASLPEFAAPNENNGGTTAFNFATSNDIRLSGYQNKTFTSPPGSTITVNLQNFVLSGHSSLSLVGSAISTFIINVTGQFSLSGSAQIVLSGGVQWNHVFFNVLGTGSAVSLSGKSGLVGTLTASQRIVRLTDHAIVYGQIFANRLVIRQAARVINPPPVSQ